MLTVVPPVVGFEAVQAGVAALEKPLEVLVGPVSSDGSLLGPDALTTYGFHVYRRTAAGAGLEIWNDGDKRWSPDTAVTATATPTPLSFQAAEPNPWRGLIVAAGGRDSLGEPQYVKAVAGYPNYSVRAFFAASAAEAVLSAPSSTFAFASVSDANLMVVGPGEDEEATDATEVRVLLKDPALQTLGRLLLERSSPGARITLDNAAGASIVLHPDGHIVLTPAAGQPVVVAGDLEAERVLYQPAGGGVKRWLP